MSGWDDIEASREAEAFRLTTAPDRQANDRQANALERIATALEVLVVVEVFDGLDSARANMPGCVNTIAEVLDFFREARDA